MTVAMPCLRCWARLQGILSTPRLGLEWVECGMDGGEWGWMGHIMLNLINLIKSLERSFKRVGAQAPALWDFPWQYWILATDRSSWTDALLGLQPRGRPWPSWRASCQAKTSEIPNGCGHAPSYPGLDRQMFVFGEQCGIPSLSSNDIHVVNPIRHPNSTRNGWLWITKITNPKGIRAISAEQCSAVAHIGTPNPATDLKKRWLGF